MARKNLKFSNWEQNRLKLKRELILIFKIDNQIY
jgi:uncharacterized membrane protein